jgi:hypothetical protein
MHVNSIIEPESVFERKLAARCKLIGSKYDVNQSVEVDHMTRNKHLMQINHEDESFNGRRLFNPT